MATKGERQALLFLAAVALLGAGTRVVRARHPVPDSVGLDQQLEAVEALRSVGRKRPASSVRPGRRRSATESRVDSPPPAAPSRTAPIDIDIASADEIERLPGIGPAIARRIVADRDARGAFGCLGALDAVKGIGPAMLGRLDSVVVFSGTRRPECASAGGRPSPAPIPVEARPQE